MGVFDHVADQHFARFKVQLQLNDWIVGGTPVDPKVIEGWLRTKAAISDETELREQMVRVLQDMGANVTTTTPWDDLVSASEKLAADKHTVGFRRDPEIGLYLEARCVKAMLKEIISVAYSGVKWGATAKGSKNYLAERVFVSPSKIGLGVDKPSGIHLFVGHVSGPEGPRSTLSYYEYVDRPLIEFEVWSLDNAFTYDEWARMWVHAQSNGLGALRSQGFGTFEAAMWAPQNALANGQKMSTISRGRVAAVKVEEVKAEDAA